MLFCQLVTLPSGAHNDVRVEGKGRSVQQPRKRLKLKTFSQ